MTIDEAREAAWREYNEHDFQTGELHEAHAHGWDARGQHDKEQIAAMVEAIIWMSGSGDFAPGKPAYAHWVEIRDGVLARALAGQSEEATCG